MTPLEENVSSTTPDTKTVLVGSRCSELALRQTNLVIHYLKEKNPSLNFHVVKMSTRGDEIQNVTLSKIGGKSLFTKELEVALADGAVDFVVHSLKDLPTTLPPGLTVGAVIARADPRDCVILHPKHEGNVARLDDLPRGAILGTSSLRRSAQLSRNFPHIKFRDIRGTLNTRVRKLTESEPPFDGIILARAGVERMGWQEKIGLTLGKDEMLYAVGQGAMAVECRADDVQTLSLLSQVHDRTTALRVTAERSFMRELDGGCSVPIGTWSIVDESSVTLTGAVFSRDGTEMLYSEVTDPLPLTIPGDVTPPDTIYTSPHHSPPLSHSTLDLIHNQQPSTSTQPSTVQSLLQNNIIVHRTGCACAARDVRAYDVAEECGLRVARELVARGAKEVLATARAGGVVNVNQLPAQKRESAVLCEVESTVGGIEGQSKKSKPNDVVL